MDGYIPRTLSYFDDKGEAQRCSDRALLQIESNIVVLGEPGIGKSQLLRWIAEERRAPIKSAASFVRHPDPKALISGSEFVVIDGLDELAAANETDPINDVLAKLASAGSPRFVLSCRSAEWRGVVARQELSDQYGALPFVATLEGLSADDAKRFLADRLSPERADELINDLDSREMAELYRNPLSLSLLRQMAMSAAATTQLTRATILASACDAMWHEARQSSDRSPLALLDQTGALDAAGACFAALILSGSEAVALRERAATIPTALHHTEISALPGGADALAIAGSRLFVPADAEGHVKPIHRSVAEYLGARWLARQADDDERRERLLALITIDAGVPASLRGIHAWLPHFDPKFREAVVAIDPYGVLIYGDANASDPELGRALLSALRHLEQQDPYFRSGDWRFHSAKALAQPALEEEIRSIFTDSTVTPHLRILVLQAIRGSAVVPPLRGELLTIVRNSGPVGYVSTEREIAAEALIGLQDSGIDWPNLAEQLRASGDHADSRLAIDIIELTNFAGITGEQVAHFVLSHMGLLDPDEDDDDGERTSSGALFSLPRAVPLELIPQVLDGFAAALGGVDRELVRKSRSDLATMISRLVVRLINTGSADALKIADWLSIVRSHSGYSLDDNKRINEFFAQNAAARRAVQGRAIYEGTQPTHAWGRLFRLPELSPALHLTVEDAVYFLEELAGMEQSPRVDEIWLDLLSFSRRSDGTGRPIIEAARAYAGSRADLNVRIEEFMAPRSLEQWEIEERKRQEAREKQRQASSARTRATFEQHIDEIRAGTIRTVPLAQAYLGLFNDLDSALPGAERIRQWVGHQLCEAALAGFEAALHREDIPSVQQIAESYAKSSRWNIIFALVAGFAERYRSQRGYNDLGEDILFRVRLGIEHEHIDELKAEASALDTYIRADFTRFERYCRLLIEPSLKANVEHVHGLYAFVRDAAFKSVAPKLASEWLATHSQLTPNNESELIDALIDAGEFGVLRRLAIDRLSLEALSDDRRANWLATQFLVDFSTFRASVPQPLSRDLIWRIRHVLRGERLRDLPPVEAQPEQLAWVVQRFRHLWPKHDRPSGMTRGNDNDWDASSFLEGIVSRLTSDLSPPAAQALRELRDASPDGYTEFLRHAADVQRRARREANFVRIGLQQLKAVLEATTPEATADLQVVVLRALAKVQAELRGSATDAINNFYGDVDRPRDEAWCNKRVAEIIRQHLVSYSIEVAPEVLMPDGKRADLLFTVSKLGLPVECKGQWNKSLWTAAREQLEEFYLPDSRAQGRGIYLVYWFGQTVEPNRKLFSPRGRKRPTSAEELKRALSDSLGLKAHGSIAVEVLDLSR